jgi:hypothetical protein
MVVIPPETPVTIPEAPTVATDVMLLLHEPPGVTSLNDVVTPMHKLVSPVMGNGNGLTIINAVVAAPHPLA